VVDDDLVAAVGAQGSLNGAGDGLAGLDVADNSSILSVVAVSMELWLAGWTSFWSSLPSERIRRWDLDVLGRGRNVLTFGTPA
jgi:hypothetical protein